LRRHDGKIISRYTVEFMNPNTTGKQSSRHASDYNRW
jgi:hypothetical protein